MPTCQLAHIRKLTVMLAILAGCATPPPITSQPSTLPIPIPQDSTVATGLQNAAFNLDQAVAIGALPADDPAPVCVHGFLQQAGLEALPGAPPSRSYTPKVSDLISAGSVLYIRAQQARAAGPYQPPAGCDAILGRLVREAAAAGLTAATTTIPGAGALQVLINGR